MVKRILLAVLCATATPAVAQRLPVPADHETLMAVLRAENTYGRGNGMTVLLDALRHEDDRMRVFAVRAIGRLERNNLVSVIAPLLNDNVAEVRYAAANAVAQAAFREVTNRSTRVLINRLEVESDPLVVGGLIAALGRMPYTSTDRMAEVESAMIRHTRWDDPGAVVDIARGWEAFARRTARTRVVSAAALPILDSLVRFVPAQPRRRARRVSDVATLQADVREMGVVALAVSRQLTREQLELALDDSSWEVRRAAMAAARQSETFGDVIGNGVRDPHFAVRVEALRGVQSCGPLLGATSDTHPNVGLLAIDLVARVCPDSTPVRARLEYLADQPATDTDWHVPAHALVALAAVSPESARQRLQAASESPVWWLRMYTARAAGQLQAVGLLEQLAYDSHDNVREAAVRGLSQVAGREADPILLQNLRRPDYQLILTIARALEGTEHPDALPALFETLFRITAEGKDTSRDPRMELIRRISELGNAQTANAMTPYLRDFDPLVANTVADIIERWTGSRLDPMPTQRDRGFPDFPTLRQVDGTRMTLHMSRGGSFTIQLNAFDAPTNVVRFVNLALQRHFDRLTFHRVVPNFVIQGGSPNANEYVGDGPYTNDEITSLAHVRGTVGLSTRGRHTADSQIFVNLIDNRRLDHNYTIIGEVVSGMGVIDGLLEGDVIERIDVGR